MPTATALTASELSTREPKDRTSKEWKDWKREHEAALREETKPEAIRDPAPPKVLTAADSVADLAGTPRPDNPSSPPATPPAPPAPPLAEAAPVADPIPPPSADPRRRILNPVEFSTLVLTRNPRDVIAYAGQRNSVASVAGDVRTLYEAYLLINSPHYLAHVRALNAKKPPLERAILPNLGEFEQMYSIATGA